MFNFGRENQVSVNGRAITVPNGASVSVYNGKVYVNGKLYEEESLKDCKVINIIINGDVGSVTCDGSVTCNNVNGDIRAGGSVTCDDVQGNVHCGGSVTCDDIGGGISCGGSVRRG